MDHRIFKMLFDDRSGITVKKWFVDITGDMKSAVLLQYLVESDHDFVDSAGNAWFVRSYHDWWSPLRLTYEEVRRCLRSLKSKNLITTKVAQYDGVPKTHITVNTEILMESINNLPCQEA